MINTLIHEYELFRIKIDENIYEMKKQFIHVMNHMRTRDVAANSGVFYSDEKLSLHENTRWSCKLKCISN